MGQRVPIRIEAAAAVQHDGAAFLHRLVWSGVGNWWLIDVGHADIHFIWLAAVRLTGPFAHDQLKSQRLSVLRYVGGGERRLR